MTYTVAEPYVNCRYTDCALVCPVEAFHLDDDMLHITHFLYFDEERGFAPFSRYLFPRMGKRFVEPMTGESNVPFV